MNNYLFNNEACGCPLDGNANPFEYLRTENCLAELTTEEEKASARKNLGIADNWTLRWKNINGRVEDNAAMKEILDTISENIDSQILEVKESIDSLDTSSSENIRQSITQLSEHVEETISQVEDNLQEQLDTLEESVNNLADDEDLVFSENHLKFGNKSYNPSQCSGKGFKILRKNIKSKGVNGEEVIYNLLTQEDMIEENTIYEIRYDFSLEECSIVVPEGSILNFNGGSLSNGVVICRDTIISGWYAGNVELDGTYTYDIPQVDGEDISLTESNLKFSDKQYHHGEYTGLGRVFLRKNMVVDEENELEINLLTQSMMDLPNTIYVVQYDYDLNGESIVLPANCALKFEGGSLSNGNITFKNTYVYGTAGIFTATLEVSGTVKNEIHSYWWKPTLPMTETQIYRLAPSIGLNMTFLLPNSEGYEVPVRLKNNRLYNAIGRTDWNRKTIGSLAELPDGVSDGFQYIISESKLPVWYVGGQWVNAIGLKITDNTSGEYSRKPINPPVGFTYFCTDRSIDDESLLGIPIYYKGNGDWVNANGAIVD